LSGDLIFRHAAYRFFLVDHDGIAVDVRQLHPSESVGIGSKLDFPFFLAKVGKICVSPIAPSHRLSSPLRPLRLLDPRALFRPTSVADTSVEDPMRSGSTGGGESVGALIVGTCMASGWRNLDVRERVTSRVSLVDSPLPDQISHYQHIWDRGRAAGQPRVVFID
jgi:hypothetical protein